MAEVSATLAAVRIAFLQCELEHPHQAPHLAMSLMVSDAARAGHAVRAGLVHPGHLHRCVAELRGSCDVLVLDSIFPLSQVSALRQGLGVPVVVGGHNAVQHALRGEAEVAISGPARGTLPEVLVALAGEGALGTIPGTWFRKGAELDAGPPPRSFDLRMEIAPFSPWPTWSYWGPSRAPGSDLRLPSVVAETGCPWARPALGAGPFESVRKRLPEVRATRRAQAALQRLVDAEGGCTFCTFRYVDRPQRPGADLVATLVEQARTWVELGARGLSVQSEHPLPFMPAFCAALKAEGLAGRLDEVHVRTIPFLIDRHDEALLSAIEAARTAGFRLVLAQVGFECFDDAGLALFHKGGDGALHRRVARRLQELSHREAPWFEGRHGHGFIPLHPYTTLSSLRENLDTCREVAPFLLGGWHPGRRVELYHEWGPLFWKLEDDGLLEEGAGPFHWSWRFQDPAVHALVTRWNARLRVEGGPPWRALERLLDAA